MIDHDPTDRRVPAVADVPGAPGYPTLREHEEGRRRLLKLFALSSLASALGFELTGCPPPSGRGGGGGGEWLPWEPEVRLAGVAPPPMGSPVAVVVAGGPVAVTFQDGVAAEVVAAGVVVPQQGVDAVAEVTSRTTEHQELLRRAAAGVPSSTLDDVAALDALEAQLLHSLNGAVRGGFFQEVTLARARPPAPALEPSSAPGGAAPGARPAAPAATSDAAPVGTASPPGGPPARTVWAPCRVPGCTTCGAR